MYITENDKIAIRQLIEKQLYAFKQNDKETAFSLTSLDFQTEISSSDFVTAIEHEYHAIVRHRSIMFQGFTLVDNYPALVSMIMDLSGKLIQGIFVVENQRGFGWRIRGYQLLPVDRKIIKSW